MLAAFLNISCPLHNTTLPRSPYCCCHAHCWWIKNLPLNFGAGQNNVINLLILLILLAWWNVWRPETCEGGTDGEPPEPTNFSDHTHPQRELISGGGGRGRGRAPVDQSSLLSWSFEDIQIYIHLFCIFFLKKFYSLFNQQLDHCVTWNGVVQAKSQKTSNKHLSGQKNREDLIQFRDTYIVTQ